MFLYKLICSLFLLVIEAAQFVVSDNVKEYGVDKGDNITLPCIGLPELTNPSSVMWVHDSIRNKSVHKRTIQQDGSLHITFAEPSNTGVYSCVLETDKGKSDNTSDIIYQFNLTVRTEPPPLVNVSVTSSTILAVLMWDVGSEGGYTIMDFTAEYRESEPNATGYVADWTLISPTHISPTSRQIEVYHLEPNTSYSFRVWATNSLGPGPPVVVHTKTRFTDEQTELIRHFLTGVEDFDTRTWIAAVAVVMGTLVILAVGTVYVLWREWRHDDVDTDDQDVMELVPNIILNPGFVDVGLGRQDLSNYANTIVKSTNCKGSNEPRKV